MPSRFAWQRSSTPGESRTPTIDTRLVSIDCKPMPCVKCLKDTTNPKFCSRKCAATYNNTHQPKRKKEGSCKDCATPIRKSNMFCVLCRKANANCLKTVGEYRNKMALKGRHRSWIHAYIRGMNRTWNKELTTKPCYVCGYTKHVELAHIKPIHAFSDETLLEVVNHPTNVVQLCPNCHWEFDNGLTQLEKAAPPEGLEPSNSRVETDSLIH